MKSPIETITKVITGRVDGFGVESVISIGACCALVKQHAGIEDSGWVNLALRCAERRRK